MKKPTLRDIGIVGLCFVVVGFFLWKTNDEPVQTSVAEKRDAFERDIRASGAETAYRRFKKEYESRAFNDTHLAAHLFGEALYRSLSHDGVAVCDGSFSFGCYHGLFIRAVSEEGLDVVGLLDDVCQKTNIVSACQHGIGHGILEYLGHDELTEALSACGKTKRLGPVGGCSSGVFMEYNVPLNDAQGMFSTAARPLMSADEPYEPCSSVPSEYRESCYHELPQWWRQVYGDDFALFGRFCSETGDQKLADACTGGIGYLAASAAGYDVSAALSRCSRMPTSDMGDSCTTNAAAAFSANVGDAAGAGVLCAAVSGHRQGFCTHIQ